MRTTSSASSVSALSSDGSSSWMKRPIFDGDFSKSMLIHSKAACVPCRVMSYGMSCRAASCHQIWRKSAGVRKNVAAPCFFLYGWPLLRARSARVAKICVCTHDMTREETGGIAIIKTQFPVCSFVPASNPMQSHGVKSRTQKYTRIEHLYIPTLKKKKSGV